MAAGLNIVVVEDHEDLLALTVEVLRREGHHVTGLSCAEAIDDEGGGLPIDLLAVDLNLPGEDGLSLARRFRTAQPDSAIIMVTSRNRAADRVAGYESGADIYLAKPVSPEELVAAVKAVGRRLEALDGSTSSAGEGKLALAIRKLQLRGSQGQVEVSSGDAANPGGAGTGAWAKAPGLADAGTAGRDEQRPLDEQFEGEASAAEDQADEGGRARGQPAVSALAGLPVVCGAAHSIRPVGGNPPKGLRQPRKWK